MEPAAGEVVGHLEAVEKGQKRAEARRNFGEKLKRELDAGWGVNAGHFSPWISTNLAPCHLPPAPAHHPFTTLHPRPAPERAASPLSLARRIAPVCASSSGSAAQVRQRDTRAWPSGCSPCAAGWRHLCPLSLGFRSRYRLAFAHIVLAVFFIGPLVDPVRNVWVLWAGLIACAGVLPLALICGPLRGIPFYWRLIDCSFGVVGALPLVYRLFVDQTVDDQSKLKQELRQQFHPFSKPHGFGLFVQFFIQRHQGSG